MKRLSRTLALAALVTVALVTEAHAHGGYSNLSPTGTHKISGPALSSIPEYHVAVDFTVPFDTQLSSVNVPINAIAGTSGQYTLALHDDAAGIPGNQLVSFGVHTAPSQTNSTSALSTIAPSRPISLRTGVVYWLVASPDGPASICGWSVNNQGALGTAQYFNGTWTYFPTWDQPALRVNIDGAHQQVFSNLSTSAAYHPVIKAAVLGSNQGEVRFAVPFTPQSDMTLGAVDLALLSTTSGIEPDDVAISVHGDLNGMPGGVVDHLGTFSGFPRHQTTSTTMTNAVSTYHASLQAGRTYWVVCRPADPNTEAYWHRNDISQVGTVATHSTGSWSTSQGILPAMEVYAYEPLVENYCMSGTSASGCQATLSSEGTPCANSSYGFTVKATNVEGAKDGLFFYGTSGRQANTWGSGTSFQCVVPPVKRTALVPAAAGSVVGTCDGSFSLDLNTLWSSNPQKHPGEGAVVQLQFWYRDPFNTSNQTTSLSNAMEFTVRP